MCPYDLGALDPTIIDEAQRSHPFIRRGSTQRESASYHGIAAATASFDAPLLEPPGEPSELAFDRRSLVSLRGLVSEQAANAGLGAAKIADLVLAVSEVATNSLRYGGGHGTLRTWQEADALVCEICDAGHINHPLVGRERPTTNAGNGRGLWLVNQLCDLVELRSFSAGTTVRLRMRA